MVANILKWLGIENPTYLDIGAYHSSNISNTYLLYLSGCSGICIEPDPFLYAEVKYNRPKDTVLNIGIGKEKSFLSFFQMENKTLNTFVEKEAREAEALGISKISNIIQVEVTTINDVIAKYASQIPNFISIDVEGMQMDILYSFDFHKYKPEIFCIETQNSQYEKITAINDFMIEKGYFVCADTYINTIFVLKDRWDNRLLK
ncbi:MAG: FkbM family methyltransferase [Microscillaceae bacterium]|nr:FkbM family methyltransferase [Microscillaceae bacterium]